MPIQKSLIVDLLLPGKVQLIDLLDELTLTEDYDAQLVRQAADYAFFANARVEAQFADQELRHNQFTLWQALASEVAKAALMAAGEKKPTISGIEAKLKAIFASKSVLEVHKVQYASYASQLESNPFIDFVHNDWGSWQNALQKSAFNVERLRIVEEAIKMRGFALTTLCQNRRFEDAFIENESIRGGGSMSVKHSQRASISEARRAHALKSLTSHAAKTLV